MSDIFVSYAREDREVASRLSARLKSEGWTVFWDSDLRTGDDWRKLVENEVKTACCVVVLWSKDSIGAHWVQEEAHVARERNVVLPALLGVSKPPFGFGGRQACNLTDWDGVAESAGLADLINEGLHLR